MYREEIPKLGGDPEFFIVRTAGVDNAPEIISADKFLPPKDNKFVGNRGEIFFDGVQGEINPHPSECRESFTKSIFVCLRDVYYFIDRIRNEKKELAGKYNLWAIPTVEITRQTIEGADYECCRFGCSPDFNIYPDEPKIKYPDGKRHLRRYAGGHIHLGFEDLISMDLFAKAPNIKRLVQNLDIFLGIFSTAIIKDNEGEKIRRKLYGKAGTYRLNGHGIEYRVPSSFWIAHPALVSLITSVARNAYTATIRNLDSEAPLKHVDISVVRKIINTCDRDSAIAFYFDVLKPYYSMIFENSADEDDTIYYSPLADPDLTHVIDKIVENGFESYFNPRKVFQNWGITRGRIKSGCCVFRGEDGFATWGYNL